MEETRSAEDERVVVAVVVAAVWKRDQRRIRLLHHVQAHQWMQWASCLGHWEEQESRNCPLTVSHGKR